MQSTRSTRGAVASELQLASDIGADILRQGGSAADAIIATTLAIGTTCAYHSGIGGGGFAIIRNCTGAYESLDFRHCAPAAATAEYYEKQEPAATARGGQSVAVPGELRGLEELHKRYGKVPWKTLVEPSIRLARDGFPFTQDCLTRIKQWTLAEPSCDLASSWLLHDPVLRSIYAPESGADQYENLNSPFPQIGSLLRNEAYARALEAIANQGPGAFYSGPMAKAIVDTVQRDGGLLSLSDLSSYRVEYNMPLHIHYRGRKITSIPAPGSGAIYLSALATLAQFEPAEGPDDPRGAHRLIEGLKFAYAQRSQLGDPNHNPGLKQAQQDWISTESAAARAARIDDLKTLAPEEYNAMGLHAKDDHGTSNITAWDGDGLVISITTTVTLPWGSRMIVPSYGIVLNDTMEDFSVDGRPNAWGLQPSSSNFIAGGKRALSSSCPYIVENEHGDTILAGGCAGGSRIISANVQVTRNILDFGMSAKQALRAPRLHDQIRPEQTEVEQYNPEAAVRGFSSSTSSRLLSLGHAVKHVPRALSNPCAITKTSDGWEAAGEPRLHESGGTLVL